MQNQCDKLSCYKYSFEEGKYYKTRHQLPCPYEKKHWNSASITTDEKETTAIIIHSGNKRIDQSLKILIFCEEEGFKEMSNIPPIQNSWGWDHSRETQRIYERNLTLVRLT